MSDRVDIPRFVRPSGRPSGAGGGYLTDPTTAYGRAIAPDTKVLAEAFDKPCTVVLGEPGLGKSDALAQRRRSLGSTALFYNLAWDKPDAVLADESFQAWQQNQADLHLVVDSLDESSDPRFPTWLVGKLRQGPIDRLRLELACRAAEWPVVLATELPRLFDNDDVAVWHFEPLRVQDVAAFAEWRQVEARTFLPAVDRVGARAIAARPLTLLMLLDVFAADGDLPLDGADLYERACLLHCEEQSHTRTAPAQRPLLEPRQRLEIAQWVAAATVLAKKPVFVTQRSAADIPQSNEVDDVQLADAISDWDRESVRDVSRSGLFTRIGTQRVGWVHQQFAEFLCARWMSRHLSTEQTKQLLAHQEDTSSIPPQNWELTGWLCCMDEDVALWVATIAPELLLVAPSPPALTDGARSRAVDEFFRRVRSRDASDWWLRPHQLQRLNHPGYSAQLLSVLQADDEDDIVRRVALDMVAANPSSDLLDAVLDMAEETDLDAHTRAAAVDAAWETSKDAATVARLRPLAERDDTDPNERVRAAVLRRLWPDHIRVPELLPLLTAPRRENFGGEYHAVILHLPEQLDATDLQTALSHVRGLPEARHHNRSGVMARFIRALCRRALAFLDDDGVRRELGRTVGQMFMHHLSPFHTSLSEADDGLQKASVRRAVVEAVVAHSEVWDGAFRVIHPYGQRAMVQLSDLPWLLERYRSATGEERARWADVVAQLGGVTPPIEFFELVFEEVGEGRCSPLLRFPLYIEIESEEADKARAEYEAALRLADLRPDREELPPGDPLAAARETLDGDLGAWWRVVRARLRSSDYRSRFCAVSLFDWDALDEADRRRLLDAGESFLLNHQTGPSMQQGYGPATAAVVTLTLLQDVAPHRLAAHADRFASRWARAIVEFDNDRLSDNRQRDALRHLVEWAAAIAPDQVSRAVDELIQRERARWHPDLHILEWLPAAPPFIGVAYRTLLASGSTPECFELLLGVLLRMDRHVGMRIAAFVLRRYSRRHRASRPRPQLQMRRARIRRSLRSRVPLPASPYRAVMTCEVLMRHGAEGWNLVWNLVCRHPQLRRVLAHHALDWCTGPPTGPSLKKGAGTLAPTVVAGIYAWLVENRRAEAGPSRVRDAARIESLLEGLVEQATADSVAALEALRQERPDDDSVAFRLPDAVRRFRDATWSPPDFEALVALAASNQTGRLVQSHSQLMDAVLFALREFEKELHSENPTIMRLWIPDGSGSKQSYRPRDEAELSREITLALTRYLAPVIVNREVEIRPAKDSRKGQRVDLLVDAIHPISHQRLSVVIEVKGSWNQDIGHALETQLVRRYLTDGRMNHGIYVVGWFTCTNWSDGNPGRRDACLRRDRDRESIEQRLREQAREASVGTRRVEVVIIDAGIR